MTADLSLVSAPLDWMEPLRQSIKRLVLADGCSVQRRKRDVPVVTYVNRQLTGRRLRAPDAEALVAAMKNLEQQGIIEFNDAVMERKSRIDQVCWCDPLTAIVLLFLAKIDTLEDLQFCLALRSDVSPPLPTTGGP